ncbi:uncharacterized protein LOC114537695 [Dendronephthya gigantea]|uniref:uncharacterized protein LOC114537695 n=1 Tax=Dendronephthya gigantea TaxID=151771 RepID=UPI00106C27BE|nr:uncharacterized protein LOC114537695 [Dendronephthya gigantea]
MNDFDQNVRVSFKLSREAAMKLREFALTKTELLCNLGVFAVQLGNESQICISSPLNFDKDVLTGASHCAKTSAGRQQKSQNGQAKKPGELRDSRRSLPKIDKALLNVDRGVRPVDLALARATADSVMISDGLSSMNSLNKAAFMNRTSTQKNRTTSPKTDLISRREGHHNKNSLRDSSASAVGNSSPTNQVAMKPISYHGVIKFNSKNDEELCRSSPYGKEDSDDARRSKNVRGDSVCRQDEIQDGLSRNIERVASDATKYGKELKTASEDVRKILTQSNEVSVPKSQVKSQDLSKASSPIDPDSNKNKDEKRAIKMDAQTATLNEHDGVSHMTDSFECSVNTDINSGLSTFPAQGISFAQHLINLSKQYRLENEKSPIMGSEKFFATQASRIVRNDHVLRCFTTGCEKQEDFMGFTGQNALLFDGSYKATAVKSAEELSKEQSEASPTNLDSMSETSADSLFEDARLGSVDELSLSPSSNENAPASSEENSRATSPSPPESKRPEDQQTKTKQENRKRKLYQRYVKGHTGIICKLCMHPVSKSYSCYKLAHAPKEIRHLFDDGSHCVRVCRRCLPYKSPKRSEKNTQKKLHKTIEKLLK